MQFADHSASLYIYIYQLAHHIPFDPKGGGKVYLRNVDNTAHIHAVQRPKSRINIKNYIFISCLFNDAVSIDNIQRRMLGRLMDTEQLVE
jgi:hypothetical protein